MSNLKMSMLLLGLIVLGSSANVAEAKKERRKMLMRINTKGQPQAVPKARNLAECVAGGMSLGHPRVGPNGEFDRRGALGFCHSRGF
jgi:hypothetical protein